MKTKGHEHSRDAPVEVVLVNREEGYFQLALLYTDEKLRSAYRYYADLIRMDGRRNVILENKRTGMTADLGKTSDNLSAEDGDIIYVDYADPPGNESLLLRILKVVFIGGR